MAQYAKSEKAHRLFENHVRHVVSRTNRYTNKKYCDDPAIMAWQIGNEPRLFGTDNKESFAMWIADCAALIKSIDPNHLVSVGSEGMAGCEGDLSLWVKLHQDANIDYSTIHIWPNNWGWIDKTDLPGTLDKAIANTGEYIDKHIAEAEKMNKPLVLEEFGMPRDSVKFDRNSATTLRDKYYGEIFAMVKEHAAKGNVFQGCNFWAWGGLAQPQHLFWQKGDDYMGDPGQEEQGLNSVYDTDATVKLVADMVNEINQMNGAGYIRLKKDKKTGVSYYDFNKNGYLDHYENPDIRIQERVSDLLSQMTLEEKIGQMLTSLGWAMYERQGNSVRLTEQLTKEIEEYHTGSLWGFMRADPWTQRTLTTGLSPALAVKASNMLQRVAIEHGRLGIPLFLAEECPHGHMAIGTTVFPTSIGQASTWNPELIQRMGQAIAAEASAQGAHIGYGPVLDLARDPRWSRVEETYGEDPYLNGVMGAALVKGFQNDLGNGKSIIATLKHFAAYGWTEGGHNGGSAHIGAREMEEAIYPPFREAVAAGALSVMSSYNEIDGIPCTANHNLLTDVLKKRWQFDGFVVSDLYAIGGLREHGVAVTDYDAAVKAVIAGVDSDLGTNVYAGHLVSAVRKGDVSEAVINEAVSRILRLKFRIGLFDRPFIDEKIPAQIVASSKHVELAREVARQSLILLKNENALLPLDKDVRSIAVIGPNADNVYNMLGDYTAPQSEASVVTVLDGIRQKVSDKTRIRYAKGCAVRDSSIAGFQEAVEAARQADVVIMVMGGSSARDFSSKYEETGAAKISDTHISDMESGEGYDRSTLELLGRQRELIHEIRKLGKPVVLVLIKGRPLLLEGIETKVNAIVDAWYPGMQGGNAIADVLFGDYNPAGRLTISVPRSVGQLPVYYNTKRKGNRSKYIEEEGTPRYPFGYGLSYTSFGYSDMQTEVDETRDDCQVSVSVMVRNEGSYDGDEVVQLYLRDEVASFTTPFKQLRGFQRIHLKAGEAKKVTFLLDKKSLSLYMQNGEWAVEPGRFVLMVGSSSEQIILQKEIEITRKYSDLGNSD